MQVYPEVISIIPGIHLEKLITKDMIGEKGILIKSIQLSDYQTLLIPINCTLDLTCNKMVNHGTETLTLEHIFDYGYIDVYNSYKNTSLYHILV